MSVLIMKIKLHPCSMALMIVVGMVMVVVVVVEVVKFCAIDKYFAAYWEQFAVGVTRRLPTL